MASRMLTRVDRLVPLAAIKSTVKARRRAPRHPIKPERRLRKAVRVLFDKYHARLIFLLVETVKMQRMILSSETEVRRDVKTALRSAAAYGVYLLDHSPFKTDVKGAASDLATSARNQTARALKKPVDADLGKREFGLYDATYAKTQEQMALSLERAEDVYDQWDELPEDAEDYEDEDALAERLDEGLSGVVGGALAAASLYFGWAFGQMIKDAQTDSGVSEYTWLAVGDSHTRPAHEALNGEVASWDDPPLSALDSDSGEACHPGEDYGCRCVASPIGDGEEAN